MKGEKMHIKNILAILVGTVIIVSGLMIISSGEKI